MTDKDRDRESNQSIIDSSAGKQSRVQHPTRQVTGHVVDESFQAIDCTGTTQDTRLSAVAQTADQTSDNIGDSG